jgi:DNA-binding MarR family transcriptional regulator
MERKDVDLILEGFIEAFFHLMLDHHRTHVVELELTVVQVQALTLLREESSPATRLATYLGISGPAMTQLTDRLIRKHLIERGSAEGDRRAVMIALTGQGRRVVDRFRKRRSEVFAEALSRVSASDQTEVVDALNKLAIALAESGERKIASAPSIPLQRPKPRTAVLPAEASKEAGDKPVSLPVRRMRIEWD